MTSKIFLYVLILFLNVPVLFSQKYNPEKNYFRYWIYFKDKGEYKQGRILEKGSDAYNLARSGLSEKTIWRRSKVLPEHLVVSYDDLPVNQEYIKLVEDCGVKYHAVSKWFNAISVK
ncbi:MAG: hypothetical protein N2510_09800, partial [Ignavibacteria bacterium]|nr:hypothetical protein [Ignavibacteria bacterium]